MTRSALPLCALLLVGACGPDAEAKGESELAADRPAGPRPPLIFDPPSLRRGAEIGEMRVDSLDVVWGEGVGEWVGVVRFTGAVRLTGSAIPHLVDPEADAVCFEADSASGRRLPRWPGDERRPWFCFENTDDARRMLGSADSARPATVMVDRFTTVRAFTDAVNSARLVGTE